MFHFRKRIVPLLVLCWILVACLGKAHEDRPPHFTYEGKHGPSEWSHLAASYRTCSTGRHQSPINIDTERVEHTTLPPLNVHYQVSAILEVNNGHTIEDDVAPGDFISLGDVDYQLIQFHFHHPSEHTLDGKHFPLEVHLVHQNSRGQTVVIAVFAESGSAHHPALSTFFDHLPTEHQAFNLRANPATLLPVHLDFVEYEGSLTTPPCTEGVTWLVLTEPVFASAAQIMKFAALYPHNNRPLMPQNGRHLLSGL